MREKPMTLLELDKEVRDIRRVQEKILDAQDRIFDSLENCVADLKSLRNFVYQMAEGLQPAQ